MTERDASKSSVPDGLTGPARDFAAYSERELERRRISTTDFDEEAYDEAVRLVLRKLGVDIGGEE